ncbi:hypothetical protein D1007_44127 [Hordeum vulgare]|nr:hypothetical protein D1007_44127 [Hordeum vulgare]
MCTTATWVLMVPSSMSTPGRLFVQYLDINSSIVSNMSELCSVRNGAHQNVPVLSSSVAAFSSLAPPLPPSRVAVRPRQA